MSRCTRTSTGWRSQSLLSWLSLFGRSSSIPSRTIFLYNHSVHWQLRHRVLTCSARETKSRSGEWRDASPSREETIVVQNSEKSASSETTQSERMVKRIKESFLLKIVYPVWSEVLELQNHTQRGNIIPKRLLVARVTVRSVMHGAITCALVLCEDNRLKIVFWYTRAGRIRNGARGWETSQPLFLRPCDQWSKEQTQ